MNYEDLTAVPRVTLGRTGIVSTRIGLGCAVWPLKRPYDQVVENLRTAFALGIRHIDIAPKYRTEEIIGQALKDVGAPADMVLSTKTCSYQDDLGVVYREYSDRTTYRSVERSLKRLQVDHIDIVHLHDVEPLYLPQVFGKGGALQALLDLKRQGVVRSIGMATYSLECLQAAVESGGVDHIQPYHTYTLLNQELKRRVLPSARAKNLSILNNAPYAGYILLTGTVSGAQYNYKPAERDVIEAAERLEAVCARKGVSLAAAALTFSLLDPEIAVTVVGASSPERMRHRVSEFTSSLTVNDFQELVAAARGPFLLTQPHEANPCNIGE